MPASDLRTHLAYALSAAERAAHRELSAALAEAGITVEQWRILSALAENPGQPMGELAEIVLMPHPTLTKAVDRLVDSALVYRHQDPADRRRVVVYLSDQGSALLDRAKRRAASQHRAMERALGPERTERLMHDLVALVRMIE
ncbi:MarR family transcriptional regulator [Longispora sp. K20-0274]|uniref:MarR family winged helix-turn-helix transcriptional regulator n=1 Tax=Longispora sp. K20-0274 TaxID=3088255 RepID=UPI00399BF45B